MENFTPFYSLIGGLIIGLAATLSLWANGRIAGISGMLGNAFLPQKQDRLPRLLFIAGIILGPYLYMQLSGNTLDIELQAGPILTVVAGLLVGFGTRLGSGCTSGHGICGLARFSGRSFAATATFMVVAIVTVFITRHIMALSP